MKQMKRIWRRVRADLWILKKQVYFSALRLLGQLPASQNQHDTSSRKVIYLTFDDGPCLYTERLLEILDRYNVKATFFVTYNPNYLKILQKIAEAGHSVGSHTANHDYNKLYESEASFLDALGKMEEMILDRTGIRPTLFRFPGGSASIYRHTPQNGMAHRLTALVQERGYQYFDWDVDSRDTAEAQTPGAVYKKIILGVQNRQKTVVLQHDIKKFSVDAVEAVIVWGLRNGYTFLPLDRNSPAPHHIIGA